MTSTEPTRRSASPPVARPAELLEHYAELVRVAVGRALASGPGETLRPLMATYPGRSGKGLRPALLLATCEAFGGDVRDALPTAVALELMHNAFLVHDDIEDDTARRRGAATLHVDHGVPLAVHAGDALAVQAVLPLLDQPRLSAHLVQRVTREFLDTASRTLDGQGRELAWRGDPDTVVTPDDYLRLVLDKSCWYTTIFPLRAGCLIGGRGSIPLGPLTRFGFLLGAAFQIRDDLLDLVGDAAMHGKESCSDLREAKRTLPLIHLVQHCPEDERPWLQSFLAATPDRRTTADLEWVLALMERCGSIAVARGWADGLVAGARAEFATAFARAASPFHVRGIEELIAFMVERTG
jgi:geranylgeranyl diphosphate synthase type II